jgi:putative intracellular protease/amidase
VDPRSRPTPQQEERWADAIAALSNTMPISAANPRDYSAVFLPGGHGTMFDLPSSTHLTNILEQMTAAKKIVAAVCHGPAAFVTKPSGDRTSIVAGKTITSFTDAEEHAAGMEAKMPFLLESTLRSLGANVVTKPNWSDHVEIDGNLITGQNPQSSLSTARAVIAALGVSMGVRSEPAVV